MEGIYQLTSGAEWIIEQSSLDFENLGRDLTTRDIVEIISRTDDRDVVLKFIDNLAERWFQNHLVVVVENGQLTPMFASGWEDAADDWSEVRRSTAEFTLEGNKIAVVTPEELNLGDIFVDLMIFPPDQLTRIFPDAQTDLAAKVGVIGEVLDDHSDFGPLLECLEEATKQLDNLQDNVSNPDPPASLSPQLRPSDNVDKQTESDKTHTREPSGFGLEQLDVDEDTDPDKTVPINRDSRQTSEDSDNEHETQPIGERSTVNRIQEFLPNAPRENEIRDDEIRTRKVLPRLRSSLSEADSLESAVEAADILLQYRDRYSVPILIQALIRFSEADTEPLNDVLQRIAIAPKTEPKQWLKWWRKNMQKSRKRWLIEGLQSDSREQRQLAKAELDWLEIDPGYHLDMDDDAISALTEKLKEELHYESSLSSSTPID